jgi:membrane-bound lytic murein transglycosylase C
MLSGFMGVIKTSIGSLLILTGIHCFILALPVAVNAQQSASPKDKAPEDPMEGLFDALEKSSEGFFDDQDSKMDALWTKMEAEEEAKWKRLEQEVLQKWDSYVQTSKKVWVDYSGERDAVSEADFENGKVVIEAVVPASAPDPKEAAKKLIAEKAQDLVQKQAPDGKPVMQEMLPKETIKAVTEATVEPIVDPKPIVGKDGVERVKIRVELTMVPDHVKKRAERYTAAVEEQAHKRGVEPALVMAVMHTESAFNPMARSPVPAFGLMQLVPRFGAKEAYLQLYGQEKVLDAEYLYDPKNNIELGATYLARLEQLYFKDIVDAIKRRYVAICAYNWGPTAMRKKFVDQVKIDGMKAEELFRLLQKRVPNETKDYLQRVEERRSLYGG